jgi:uncharacterized membrane protein
MNRAPPEAPVAALPARPGTITRTTAASRIAALACALALIVLGVGWELAWARIGHGTLVVKVLPLVAALPGLSRYRLYTYRWVGLVVWLYAAEGALRLRDAAPVPALAALELALALALFTACATQVRGRFAAARRTRAGDPDAGPAR